MWWLVILVTLRDGLIFHVESYFAPDLSPEQLRPGMVETAPRDD